MQVFDIRNRLVADYAAYVRGFIRIRDQRISRHVEQSFDHGHLWPEPPRRPTGVEIPKKSRAIAAAQELLRLSTTGAEETYDPMMHVWRPK